MIPFSSSVMFFCMMFPRSLSCCCCSANLQFYIQLLHPMISGFVATHFCCHLSIRTDDCTSLTFPLQLLNILSFVNFQLYYLFMFLNQLVNFLVIFIDSCLCYDCREFIMLSWAWLCWEPYLLLLLLLNI